MGFAGPGCSVKELDAECFKLRRSNASFKAHKREIFLALSPASQVRTPLNLTLQHSDCNISCKGGTVNKCNTSLPDFYWQNVSSPFYFDTSNITSHRYYCVTASIGGCCHVYTNTIFVEAHKHENFSADTKDSIFSAAATIAMIFAVIGLAALFKFYMKACHSSKRERSRVTHLSLIQPFLVDLEGGVTDIAVICMYVKDRTQPFQDGIINLQSFLRYRGLNAIDIYDEEESIKSSFSHWVRRVLVNKKTKIILIDSEPIRPLWNGNLNGCRDLQSIQQAIIYTGSCIPLNELFNRLFVVRLETMRPIAEEFVYPGSGRVYLFPTNRERLWKDIVYSNYK